MHLFTQKVIEFTIKDDEENMKVLNNTSEISRPLRSLGLLYIPDLPKPVLKPESQWTDVFTNESVELFCDAGTEISDLTFTWYRNKEELLGDSVVFLDPSDSSLNITAIERAHQGGYTCQIHLESSKVKSELSNTVNITVYGEYIFKRVCITKKSFLMRLLDFIGFFLLSF